MVSFYVLLYVIVIWLKKVYSLLKFYFHINSKRGITVNELKKLEKLGYKTGKLKLDVRYLKTCRDLGICPEFKLNLQRIDASKF